jgi:hypothetical protein
MLKLQDNETLVRDATDQKFETLFDQNYLALEKETGLSRQDVIGVHSQFISFYMMAVMQDKKASITDKVDVAWFEQACSSLKYQSKQVVQHMVGVLRANSEDGKLSW